MEIESNFHLETFRQMMSALAKEFTLLINYNMVGKVGIESQVLW